MSQGSGGTATMERPTNLGGIPIGGIPAIPLDDLTEDQYLSMWGELCALRDYKVGVELLAIDGRAAPAPPQFFGTSGMAGNGHGRGAGHGNGNPPAISTGRAPSLRRLAFTLLSEKGPMPIDEIVQALRLSEDKKRGLQTMLSAHKGKQFKNKGGKWEAIGGG